MERKVFVDEKFVYVGEYKNKVKHGRGVLTFKEKYVKKIVRVVGYWKENKIDTSQIVQILYKSGDLYSGFVNNNLEKHGRGVLKGLNGALYYGNFRNSKKEGVGKEITKSVTLLGNFHNDQKNGFGILEFHDDNTKIVGCWKNDIVNGCGAIHFGNGDRYEGDIRQGIITGHGTMKYGNGNEYSGNFLFKQRHGHGIFKKLVGYEVETIERIVEEEVEGEGEEEEKKVPKTQIVKKKIPKFQVYEGRFHYDSFQHGILTYIPNTNEYIMGSWGPEGKPSGDRIEHVTYKKMKSSNINVSAQKYRHLDLTGRQKFYYFGPFTFLGTPKFPERYETESNPRFFIQSRTNPDYLLTFSCSQTDDPSEFTSSVPRRITHERTMSSGSTPVKNASNPSSIDMKKVKESDMRVRLSRRKFCRSQQFYIDSGGCIRPLENPTVVLELDYYNYKKKNSDDVNDCTIMIRSEKLLFSSVQKWYFDGVCFRNYYDISKYNLVVGGCQEWVVSRADLFPRTRIRGRKFMIVSEMFPSCCLMVSKLPNREFRLHVLKLSNPCVTKEEKKELSKSRRNYIWIFQNGQLINWGTGKNLILRKEKNSWTPDIEDYEIVFNEKKSTVPDPTWLYDGNLLIWKQQRCLKFGKEKVLKSVQWSTKRFDTTWNLINVE